MSNEREYVDVGEVTVIAETRQALLCSWDDGEEYWVPKSVICLDCEVEDIGDREVLVVKKWFAEKIGKCDKYGYSS